jgi:hypothetical protein
MGHEAKKEERGVSGIDGKYSEEEESRDSRGGMGEAAKKEDKEAKAVQGDGFGEGWKLIGTSRSCRSSITLPIT